MRMIAETMKGLSEEVRLRLLLLLADGELCVCDLIGALDLPQSTISRHLAYLKNSGWVDCRRQGVWMHYRLAAAMNSFQTEILAALRREFAASDQARRDLANLRLRLRYRDGERSCGDEQPAQHAGHRKKGKQMKPTILFLCTGNSCRSQMAEGWARHLLGDRYEIFSAGLEKHGMNPLAIKVMAEAGVDISGQYSKTVSELGRRDFDYVITLCGHASETCPWFPGRVIHHGFDDPPRLATNAASEEEALGHYRRVRDEIRDFIRSLPEELDRRQETENR
jgi:arsenate reductase (thioredoxin)